MDSDRHVRRVPSRSGRLRSPRLALVWCAFALCALAAAACSDPVSPDELDRAGPAAGDTLFASVTVGGSTACGLTRGGRAFCWGSDFGGSLGTGESVPLCRPAEFAFTPCSTRPLEVAGGWRYTALAVGAQSCGLTPSGRVLCWGGAGVSRIGPIPTLVRGDFRFRAIAPSGAAMCGLTEEGRLYCWGPNCDFELGTEDGVGGGACGPAVAETPYSATPLPVATQLRFAALGRGCAATAGGELHCWGVVDPVPFGTSFSAIDSCGDPRSVFYQYACSSRPLQVAHVVHYARPSGGASTCAVGADALAYCWGGRVQQSTAAPTETQLAERRVHALPFAGPIAEVVLRGRVTCVHAADGRVWCYGSESESAQPGIFGSGTVGMAANVPIVAVGGRRFTWVSAGGASMCGVTAEGEAYCWGVDDYGQLGSGGVAPSCGSTRWCSAVPMRVASIAGES